MITLLGVGHVFQIGNQVRRAILQRRPKVVCLELDRDRYRALLARRRRGGGPLAYRALAFFQSRIAAKYGAEVGEEMLAAASTAKEVGARLEFIDMNSGDVFSRFWGAMTLKDRVRMVFAIGTSLLMPRRRVEAEIARYEADNEAYMESFEQEFPQVKRILIDERDEYMAAAIGRLSDEHGDVVAVVGDGHIDGLRSLLSGRPMEVVRLKELRSPAEEGESGVTYSIGEGENRRDMGGFDPNP